MEGNMVEGSLSDLSLPVWAGRQPCLAHTLHTCLAQRQIRERSPEDTLHCPLLAILPHCSGALKIWSPAAPYSTSLRGLCFSGLHPRLQGFSSSKLVAPSPLPQPSYVHPGPRNQEGEEVLTAAFNLELCPETSLPSEPQGSALYSLRGQVEI